MLACTFLVYPFLPAGARLRVGWLCAVLPVSGGAGWGLALNLRLSSLEPALDEQERTDMIHSCLHSVMAVLPEPEGEDGSQEVSLRVPGRRPCLLGGQRKGCCGPWAHQWGRHLISFQSLYPDTMHALEDLLTSLLRRNMTPQGLQTMVEVSAGVHARVRRGSHPSWVSPGPPCRRRPHRGSLVLSESIGGVCEQVDSAPSPLAWASVQMEWGGP